MIDTKELRRLAQAAMHPVTKGRWMRLAQRTVYDRMEDGCRGIPVVSTDKHPPSSFEAACLDFIAAANPAAINELLDRLEAAEADALEQARLNGMGASREAALMAKLEAAEKERDWNAERLEDAVEELTALRAELETERMRLAACGVVALSNTPDSAKQARDMLPEYWSASCGDVARMVDENISLRAKVEAMEKQELVGVLHVGSYYGEELQDWEFEANQRACDKLNEEYVGSPTSLPLYALPGAQAQNVPKAVAYLDLGTGGYMDIGTDLTDEALAALPKGRHMLGIVGTYGVDGYVPAQNAPSVPEGWKLVDRESRHPDNDHSSSAQYTPSTTHTRS
jgi:hypothetical protein